MTHFAANLSRRRRHERSVCSPISGMADGGQALGALGEGKPCVKVDPFTKICKRCYASPLRVPYFRTEVMGSHNSNSASLHLVHEL